MIFEGSRYDREPVVRAPTTEGVSYPALYPRFVPNPSFVARSYRTVTGDRLDVLASQAYGSAELWWVLARANPDVFYPEDIAPGTIILVPRLDDILPGAVL